ncbi:MAG: LysR substrate-binding domain-containing protein [Pseudorhodoplanes sp.]
MKRRRLPPLKPLRVFEAVARHLSLTKAADELGVTESAVSQQIKNLEEYFGKPLLVRTSRQVQLSAEGSALLPVIASAFDQLAAVSRRIVESGRRQTLRLQVTPHLSAAWLTPRLGGFVQAHPDVDLILQHQSHSLDRVPADVDVAISWGEPTWQGVIVEPLMQLKNVPMCSPRLIEKHGRLDCIDDLESFTLLREGGSTAWSAWFAAAGTPVNWPQRSIELDNYAVLLQAAEEAQGVALLMYPMFTDHLKTNRLIAPLGLRPCVWLNFYLLYWPRPNLEKGIVGAFRNWILEEVRRDGRFEFGAAESGAARHTVYQS